MWNSRLNSKLTLFFKDANEQDWTVKILALVSDSKLVNLVNFWIPKKTSKECEEVQTQKSNNLELPGRSTEAAKGATGRLLLVH